VRADFASVAKLLANHARSAMVGAMLGGRAMTAGELARLAGVAPSTASEHLEILVAGGLVVVSAQGRHRYFGMASADVAEALEAFARICPELPIRSLRSSDETRALRRARTCYDHLAGTLGVALTDAVLARRWLVADGAGLVVGTHGRQGFADLGVDVVMVERQRRPFARLCLDWTERRPHLAGALGAAVAGALLDRGWVEPQTEGRAIRVTSVGANHLHKLLDVAVEG
jgi:DNA-binding transcriptional ArsR family regulator